jgi:hypothetical protein
MFLKKSLRYFIIFFRLDLTDMAAFLPVPEAWAGASYMIAEIPHQINLMRIGSTSYTINLHLSDARRKVRAVRSWVTHSRAPFFNVHFALASYTFNGWEIFAVLIEPAAATLD